MKEDNKDQRITSTRKQIKARFKNGMIPSEDDFNCLIDSMLNVQEDGFSRKDKEGLVIYSVKDPKRLVTFYRTSDEDPFFVIEHDNLKNEHAVKMKAGNFYNKFNKRPSEQVGDDNTFFFHLNGDLGLGKKSEDNLKLDVNGLVGMKGRIGTYKKGTVPADRQWHVIIDNLKGCQAFEVVARAGRVGSGKYAMLHAIAMSTQGKSRSTIKKTSAYYGYFWNKLNLRWVGTVDEYRLEMRSNSNYTDAEGEVPIYYNVTSLWDERIAE